VVTDFSALDVDRDIAEAAQQLESILKLAGIPEAQFFSHGTHSIVFEWKTVSAAIYATLSADGVSLLISNRDAILFRSDRRITSSHVQPDASPLPPETSDPFS
jgi:hypothetical protein